jgi:hypothetical protein
VEKWVEITKKRLTSGDDIVKSYPGKLNGDDGHLAMSKERVVFVNEKGFLKRTYNVVLDLPYNKMKKIELKDKYNLDLIDSDGTKHEFSTVVNRIPMRNIEESLRELM